MASFSERNGFREARTVIQRDSLDKETRTAVWNVLAVAQAILENASYGDDTEDKVLTALWVRHWKRPLDEKPSNRQIWSLAKADALRGEWVEVFDLVEAFVKLLDSNKSFSLDDLPIVMVDAFNAEFETYLVGYRFIGHEVTPVDSAAESDGVNQALSDAEPIKGARHSLERAVDLLADRQSPDYPNSIKESISAAEAVVKKVTGEGQLGAGLKKLEAAGLTINWRSRRRGPRCTAGPPMLTASGMRGSKRHTQTKQSQSTCWSPALRSCRIWSRQAARLACSLELDAERTVPLSVQ